MDGLLEPTGVEAAKLEALAKKHPDLTRSFSLTLVDMLVGIALRERLAIAQCTPIGSGRYVTSASEPALLCSLNSGAEFTLKRPGEHSVDRFGPSCRSLFMAGQPWLSERDQRSFRVLSCSGTRNADYALLLKRGKYGSSQARLPIHRFTSVVRVLRRELDVHGIREATRGGGVSGLKRLQ